MVQIGDNLLYSDIHHKFCQYHDNSSLDVGLTKQQIYIQIIVL